MRDPTIHRSGKGSQLDSSKELQLPMMRLLTSKTSNQAFFLRLLKVIVLLQDNNAGKRNSKKKTGRMSRFSGELFWYLIMYHFICNDKTYSFSSKLRNMELPVEPTRFRITVLGASILPEQSVLRSCFYQSQHQQGVCFYGGLNGTGGRSSDPLRAFGAGWIVGSSQLLLDAIGKQPRSACSAGASGMFI